MIRQSEQKQRGIFTVPKAFTNDIHLDEKPPKPNSLFPYPKWQQMENTTGLDFWYYMGYWENQQYFAHYVAWDGSWQFYVVYLTKLKLDTEFPLEDGISNWVPFDPHKIEEFRMFGGRGIYMHPIPNIRDPKKIISTPENPFHLIRAEEESWAEVDVEKILEQSEKAEFDLIETYRDLVEERRHESW